MSTNSIIEIIPISEIESWNKMLNKASKSKPDVFYTLEYFQLMSKKSKGEILSFVYSENGSIGFYPFILDRINDLGYSLESDYFDIQGVYGYNGVVFNTNDKVFIDNFFYQFENYLKKKGVVVEFMRINPVTPNKLLERKNFEIIFNQKNIIIDLTEEDFWNNNYEYSTRKNIKKAERNGLKISFIYGNIISDDLINEFYQVYVHTMLRNSAEKYYYFSLDFFREASKLMRENAVYVFVYLDGKVISCELILCGYEIAYSFLGGTNSQYFQFRPNDFLKHESILFLKNHEFNYYCLGGGSEGVYRYKKSFNVKGESNFYIGKKIHNVEVYEEICKQWELKNPEKIDTFSNKILKYRF